MFKKIKSNLMKSTTMVSITQLLLFALCIVVICGKLILVIPVIIAIFAALIIGARLHKKEVYIFRENTYNTYQNLKTLTLEELVNDKHNYIDKITVEYLRMVINEKEGKK